MMEVELPLDSRQLKTMADADINDLGDTGSNSPLKETNGYHENDCNGRNGLSDDQEGKIDEKEDLSTEDKENSLEKSDAIESELIAIEEEMPTDENALILDATKEEVVEEEVAVDEVIEEAVAISSTKDGWDEHAKEHVSLELDIKEHVVIELTTSLTDGVDKDEDENAVAVDIIRQPTEHVAAEEEKEDSGVIKAPLDDVSDEASEDEKPLSNLLSQEKDSPPKICVTSATPGPSGATRLDTPYPFAKISGRRGLHDSSYDPNNSFTVRSAPTTPGVMKFPRLRKFDGQDALNVATEDSRKRRRVCEELESPIPKRSKQNWLDWMNPLRWITNSEVKTETAQVADEDTLKDIKEENAEEFEPNEGVEQVERRSCVVM